MSEHEETVFTVARILLWVCTTLSVAFPLLYHFQSKGQWRHTPIGRHIMSFRGLFALMLLFTALSRWTPAIFTLYMSVLLYGLAIVVLFNQIRFVLSPETMDPDNLLDDTEKEKSS